MNTTMTPYQLHKQRRKAAKSLKAMSLFAHACGRAARAVSERVQASQKDLAFELGGLPTHQDREVVLEFGRRMGKGELMRQLFPGA